MTTKYHTLHDEFLALQEECREFVARSKSDERNPTQAELARMQPKLERLTELKELERRTIDGRQMLRTLNTPTGIHYEADQGYFAFGGGNRQQVIDHLAEKMVSWDGTAGRKALLPFGEVIIQPPMLPADPIVLDRPAPSVLNLLPVVRISSGARAGYIQQTLRDNHAAPVALGELKPTSLYGLTPRTVELSVYAHLSEGLDRFLLEDAAILARFVASELITGLTEKIELDIVAGNPAPSAPGITGLLNTSGIQVQPYGADLLGILRSALTSLSNAGFTDPVFVLSPADWERCETTRTVGSGTYDMPTAPVESATRRVWGVPVALRTGLPAGTALALDRSALALYSDRQGVRVDWGSPGAMWQRNQIQARCEGRFELAIYQPMGIIKIETRHA